MPDVALITPAEPTWEREFITDFEIADPDDTQALAAAGEALTGQRTTRHSSRPDLHAPVLDEPRVNVVQRGADQNSRRLAFC
ncbi:hypothetical protein [Streptomyces sp. NPDC052811]|uniref:hypothetical protein n=1 Tax=Streptomyces sp. NPDC052811 TaxID=3155731 RepID=UPI0034440492